MIDGIDIRKEVSEELARIAELSDKIRSGEWLGHTGKPITDVINIGIGGSYLGPQMVTEALQPYCSKDLKLHFVANLDEDQIDDCLAQLNPETSLFIICSKTFTTQETMFNANTARSWFLKQVNNEEMLAKHFVAVSSNLEATLSFLTASPLLPPPSVISSSSDASSIKHMTKTGFPSQCNIPNVGLHTSASNSAFSNTNSSLLSNQVKTTSSQPIRSNTQSAF